LDFFDSYKVHETHGDMQPELIGAYVRAQQEAGNLIDWNVAVIGQLKGKAFTDLLPDGLVVNFINRSRLEGKEDADLKAIMSQTDRAVDFGLDTAPSVTRFKTWSVEKGFFPTEPSISYVDWCADHRSPIGDESVPIHPGLRRPLILLYPIEPESPPAYPDRSRKSRQPREALNAAHPVIGLAIIFPQSQRLLAQDYWTVDLSTVEREEADLEEVEEEET
jgi:hypothetical protein